ncbi:helix-turn-helix domain-containing protein [Lentzea sp. NPDC004782]|uniref:helix-turn-helix domain-containing protein n=1 Tax=Lentzea sp. NPDC004782 TaxID=3154458 RepID=UPI0033A12FFE
MTTTPRRTSKPKPKTLDLTLAEREKYLARLARRYKNGESIRAIAKSIDRPYGTVHRWLSEAGTQFRPRGGSKQKPIPTTAPIPTTSSLIDTRGC